MHQDANHFVSNLPAREASASTRYARFSCKIRGWTAGRGWLLWRNKRAAAELQIAHFVIILCCRSADLGEWRREVRQKEKCGLDFFNQLAVAFRLIAHRFPVRVFVEGFPVGGDGERLFLRAILAKVLAAARNHSPWIHHAVACAANRNPGNGSSDGAGMATNGLIAAASSHPSEFQPQQG
jgi:hypothetical protein